LDGGTREAICDKDDGRSEASPRAQGAYIGDDPKECISADRLSNSVEGIDQRRRVRAAASLMNTRE